MEYAYFEDGAGDIECEGIEIAEWHGVNNNNVSNHREDKENDYQKRFAGRIIFPLVAHLQVTAMSRACSAGRESSIAAHR